MDTYNTLESAIAEKINTPAVAVMEVKIGGESKFIATSTASPSLLKWALEDDKATDITEVVGLAANLAEMRAEEKMKNWTWFE